MSQDVKKQQESYNTTDLAADLAKKFGLPKAQALRLVTATFTFIGNAISRDAMVRLHQFGNFKKLETKERQGRNPKTGEPTTIDASARPHFVASQTLKAKVKAGTQEDIEVEVAEEASAATTAPKNTPKQAAQTARKPIARKPVAQPAPAVAEEPAVSDCEAIDEL